MTIEMPLMRNSERKDLKTCESKWNWAWNFGPNQGLVLKMTPQTAAWFGTGWHLVWAEYYTPPMKDGKRADGFTRGRDPHETWDEYFKQQFAFVSAGPYWDEVSEKEWMDARTLGHIMIDGYLAEFKGDSHWEVLMPEQRFAASIPYNRRQKAMLAAHAGEELLAYGPHAYGGHPKYITRAVGTLDMPVRDHSYDVPRVLVVDHKTTNRKENAKQLVKDDQAGTYIAIATGYLRRAGLIGEKESIDGAVWNYARKGKPPDPATTDNQGRVRNQPQKKHYAEQLAGMTIGGVYYTEDELLSMPIKSQAKKPPLLLPDLAKMAGVRVLGEVAAKQPEPLFWRIEVERGTKNRMRQIERIADDAERMATIRAGISAPTKNPGEHCNWCQFSDLCDLDENGDPTEDYIAAVYDVRDPYADHREGAENSKESVAKKDQTGVK